MNVDLRDSVIHIYFVFVCFGLCEATDQSCGKRGTVECYECISHGLNKFCSDPFNKSYSGLKTVKCDGECVKWIKSSRNGVARYIRTCSSSLNLRISVALVCMKESPPEDGKLCFCHRDKCNAIDLCIHSYNLSHTITILLSLFISVLSMHYNCCCCDSMHDVDDVNTTTKHENKHCDHYATLSPSRSLAQQRVNYSDINRIRHNDISKKTSIITINCNARSELWNSKVYHRHMGVYLIGVDRASITKKVSRPTSEAVRTWTHIYHNNCNLEHGNFRTDRCFLNNDNHPANFPSKNTTGSYPRTTLPNRTHATATILST